VKYIDALKKILKEQAGVGIGERWIREWLILNSLNKSSSVPMNAPFTQVTALRILFEYPYHAICQVLQDEHLVSFAPYVSIADVKPTDVIIIDVVSSKVVAVFRHKSWEFRWKTMTELESWMEATASSIMKRTPDFGGSDGRDHGKQPRGKGPARKAAKKHPGG
jgi:hypothetical protein